MRLVDDQQNAALRAMRRAALCLHVVKNQVSDSH